MIRQSSAIMKRELLLLWRDKSIRNILLFGPLLGLLLFSGVYSFQRIGNIPTAIVDLDHSRSSQQVVAGLQNAADLQVIAYPETYDQIEELIQKGEVIVGIVIPEDYGKNIDLRRQTNVAMLIDGTNIAFATNATTAVLTVTRTLGAEAGVKTLVAQGIQPHQAQEAYQSIEFREQSWFNPSMNYAYFLVLGFALNMWQQFCTLAACMNIAGEKEQLSWLQIQASGVSLWKFFFLKSLVHIGIFIGIVLPIYFFAFQVFKFPLACGWPRLLVFTLVFAVSLHSLGTLMSSLTANSINATRYGMIIALPSFVLSGFTWPLQTMPHWVQNLAWILPQTWFFQGISLLTFKNPGWNLIGHYLTMLGMMSIVCYSGAALFARSEKRFAAREEKA